MASRISGIVIGGFGASAVILGAFGAHALKTTLVGAGHWETWHTAVFYHLIHAVAALGLWLRSRANASLSKATVVGLSFWLAGTLLFSGSLYVLSLGGPKWLGPITPLGGLFLIAGWCSLPWVAASPSEPRHEDRGLF